MFVPWGADEGGEVEAEFGFSVMHQADGGTVGLGTIGGVFEELDDGVVGVGDGVHGVWGLGFRVWGLGNGAAIWGKWLFFSWFGVWEWLF